MFSNSLSPFMLALVCAHVTTGSDGSPGPNFNLRILIDGQRYFTDSENIMRSWHEAAEYCESNGGQLAKVVNPVIYRQLRVSLPEIGSYWIDGIDKNTTDRFELDNKCTPETNTFELGRVPLQLPRTSCLALFRGRSRLFSRIQAMDCAQFTRVICSIPVNGGCEESDGSAEGEGEGGDDGEDGGEGGDEGTS